MMHRGPCEGGKTRGASGEQIMEAIWVASEMRAGASWAHALKAVEVVGDTEKPDS